MTTGYWLLIGLLALLAFSIRLAGLIAGSAIRRSRFASVLDDLPGLLIVALVASSLALAPLASWVAAAIALLTAWKTNNVILAMIFGVLAFAVISAMLM